VSLQVNFSSGCLRLINQPSKGLGCFFLITIQGKVKFEIHCIGEIRVTWQVQFVPHFNGDRLDHLFMSPLMGFCSMWGSLNSPCHFVSFLSCSLPSSVSCCLCYFFILHPYCPLCLVEFDDKDSEVFFVSLLNVLWLSNWSQNGPYWQSKS
jgi:hypothetical protein